MQDEIVARLANALKTQLLTAEARRAEGVPNPDSVDLFFQGMAWFNKGPTRENLTQARSFFDRAVALDPGNLDAVIGRAQVDTVVGSTYLTDDRAAYFRAAEAILTDALSLAPNNAWAHYWMGGVQVCTNRATQALAELERALALDPNLATAHATIGAAKMFSGRAEETATHVNEALRLSPRDFFSFAWMHWAGAAKLHLGADEEAVAWLRRAIESNRNWPLSHFFLAAASAHLGRLADARAAAQAGLAIDPTFTISRFRCGAESDNPTFLAQRERLIQGMHSAGLPER